LEVSEGYFYALSLQPETTISINGQAPDAKISPKGMGESI